MSNDKRSDTPDHAGERDWDQLLILYIVYLDSAKNWLSAE